MCAVTQKTGTILLSLHTNCRPPPSLPPRNAFSSSHFPPPCSLPHTITPSPHPHPPFRVLDCLFQIRRQLAKLAKKTSKKRSKSSNRHCIWGKTCLEKINTNSPPLPPAPPACSGHLVARAKSATGGVVVRPHPPPPLSPFPSVLQIKKSPSDSSHSLDKKEQKKSKSWQFLGTPHHTTPQHQYHRRTPPLPQM